MTKHLLIAINGPTAGDGDDQAYNEWYDGVHLPELLAIPGVTSAKRFSVTASRSPFPPYLSVYEIEADDVNAVLAQMATDMQPFPATFDHSTSEFIVATALED